MECDRQPYAYYSDLGLTSGYVVARIAWAADYCVVASSHRMVCFAFSKNRLSFRVRHGHVMGHAEYSLRVPSDGLAVASNGDYEHWQTMETSRERADLAQEVNAKDALANVRAADFAALEPM